MTDIPDDAVKAAAGVLLAEIALSEDDTKWCMAVAMKALTAALPHLVAERQDQTARRSTFDVRGDLTHMSTREAFEAWAGTNLLHTRFRTYIEEADYYQDVYTCNLYLAWQAGRDALLAELAMREKPQ